MADDTIQGVINQLQRNNIQQVNRLDQLTEMMFALNNTMTRFINDLLEQSRLDRMRALEEKAEGRSAAKTIAGTPSKGGGKSFDMKGLLRNLASVSGFIASIGAFFGSVYGLRGWEVKGLANVDKLAKTLSDLFRVSVIDKIEQKFLNLRSRVFKMFGLSAALKYDQFSTDPRKSKAFNIALKTPVMTQIMNGINKIRGNIYESFGFTRDGKLGTSPSAMMKRTGGKVPGRVPFVGQVFSAVDKIFSPVARFVAGVTRIMSGGGSLAVKGTINFFKSMGLMVAHGSGLVAGAKALGAVGKLFGKILWPLGIFISLWDGVKAFQEKEGNLFTKTIAGLYGFLGSFIGAPLDLIKSLFFWVFQKLGIGGYNEETGKFNTDSFSGWILQIMKEFSFESAIRGIPDAIKAIIDKVLEFMADPIGVGKEILSAVTGAITWMIKNILRYIIPDWAEPEWLSKKSAAEEQLSNLVKKKMELQSVIEGSGYRTDGLETNLSEAELQLRQKIGERNKIQKQVDYLTDFLSGEEKGSVAYIQAAGALYNENLRLAKAEEQVLNAQGIVSHWKTSLRQASFAQGYRMMEEMVLAEKIEELTKAITAGQTDVYSFQNNSRNSTSTHVTNMDVAAGSGDFLDQYNDVINFSYQ